MYDKKKGTGKMRKISVAGAGHGGIAAGMLLARKGYDVTVYELKSREEMGYDWHDCMCIDRFEKIGLDTPGEKELIEFMPMAYYNPSRTVKLTPPHNTGSSLRYIDRKFLINYLIDGAEKAGVKFVFGANITGALLRGTTVCGIRAVIDGEKKEIFSDLVIDAAGVCSPVRRSLPSELGIMNEISEKETFYIYRAYYEKITDELLDPKYTIYFFNDNRVGMDWLISDEKFVDVLIGTFGPMDMETALESVKNFRQAYPFIGEKKLRGGTKIEKIPLRRTLPVIVANGYAAVGDSAAMTEPLSGSGINLSIDAGIILADTVISAKSRNYTVSVLWDYQYKYFKKHGNGQLSADYVKQMMSKLSFKELDGLFEGKVFTEKELAAGPSVSYTPSELMEKAKSLVKFPGVALPLASFGISSAFTSSVCSLMPEQYDKEKIDKWQKLYEKL
ncbi:MAG: NAD(P)/FAD-dependent oxidoreductase [Clostridia bacterium]|nr:NAD(P)/FAD-dependent oxidoreductase [Clostridia bacterium]